MIKYGHEAMMPFQLVSMDEDQTEAPIEENTDSILIGHPGSIHNLRPHM